MAYVPPSISGYNDTPPVDDGTVSEANKVKWATTKTKLTDPLNDYIDAVSQAVDDGLGVGSDIQAFDEGLEAISGLTSAANKGIYYTGFGAAATFDLTAFARTFLDDADAASARTTLGAAPTVSPALTGNPTAPTQSVAEDSTRIATTAYVKNALGLAKAWVNFNGSGAPAIRNHYNVTSIGDHGVGDFSVNIVSGLLGDGNLCAIAMGGSTSRLIAQSTHFGTNAAYTTTSVRFRTATSAGVVDDFTNIHVVIFGD